MTHRGPLVLIESPYRGGPSARALHRAYLDLCLRDSIHRGECPIATHKLYVDCLDDNNEGERHLGMSLIHDLLPHIRYSACYYDLGISSGMQFGIHEARRFGLRCDARSLFHHPVPAAWADIINREVTPT